MKTKLVTAIALVAGLLAVCAPVFAHHGNTAIDTAHLIALKDAKITSVLWANPHIVIYFDVTDKDGKVAHWTAEGGSPEAVLDHGWRSGTLQVGDTIATLHLYPDKDGRTVGHLVDFTTPADGKTIVAWPGAANAPNAGAGRADCSKDSVSGGSVSLGCIGKDNKTNNSK